jgi:hypothetical protein
LESNRDFHRWIFSRFHPSDKAKGNPIATSTITGTLLVDFTTLVFVTCKKVIPSAESEALAQALWKETGRYDKDQRMSLINARCLISTYGVESVRNALKRLCYLQTRGKIRNASGFLIDGARLSKQALSASLSKSTDV